MAHASLCQEPQRGTGDAVRFGLNKISENFDGDVLITYGDMPAITSATLRAFLEAHRKCGAKLSFISIMLDDPAAYGRVIRDASGNVEKIVEHRDASPAERAIKEINTGCYLVDSALLRSALEQLKPGNAQGEYYLTDIVAIARRARRKSRSVGGERPGRIRRHKHARGAWQIWKRKFVRRLTAS